MYIVINMTGMMLVLLIFFTSSSIESIVYIDLDVWLSENR
jgi:hypothetical protein